MLAIAVKVSRNYPQWRSAVVFIAALVLAGCATTGSSPGASNATSTNTSNLQPFTTDACSRFPDRAPMGKADWSHCCVVHDLAYWRGGTSDARLMADQELKACVKQASNSDALAELMYVGVRAGGGPQLHTPYRWGYGWPYGRPYGPLTPEEEALASVLEREYRARNPLLPCPSHTPACR